MDKQFRALSVSLRKNADKVLSGRAKLTLRLSQYLQICSFIKQHTSDPSEYITLQTRETNLCFIVDFLQKAQALKILGEDVCELISFKFCPSIHYLEVYNVPVEVVVDVEQLKRSLRTIILNRSCSDVTAFLQSDSPNIKWKVSHASFCLNNITTISSPLSESCPYLKHLDLSHNHIRDLGGALLNLPYLQSLKISFNKLEDIPKVNSPNFKSLTARNNNIKMLDGFYDVLCVEEIDLRGNCLEYLQQLSPLSHFTNLKKLRLAENPIIFNPNYRRGVLRELSPLINGDRFLLDDRRVDLVEFEYLIMNSTAQDEQERRNGSALRRKGKEVPNPPPSTSSESDNRRLSRSDSQYSAGTSVTQNSPRKVIRIKSIPNGDEKEEVESLSASSVGTKSSDTELASSMVEKFGDTWLSHFMSKESGSLVLTPDLAALTQDLVEDEEEEEEEEEVVKEEDKETEKEEVTQAECSVAVDEEETSEPTNPFGAERDDEDEENDQPAASSPLPSVLLPPTTTSDASLYDHQSEDDSPEPGALHPLLSGSQHHALLDDQDVFLLIHENTLTEQDSIGQVLATLDITCLEDFTDDRTENKMELQFRDCPADKRHRIYRFTESSELGDFLSELQRAWITVRDQLQPLPEVQCLNCKAVFPEADSCVACGNEFVAPYSSANILITPTPSNPPSVVSRPHSEDDRSIITTRTVEPDLHLVVPTATSSAHPTEQTNFVKADYKLEIFFDVELFLRKSEVLCCFMYAQYSKYGRKKLVDCLLVVSNYMVYLCKTEGGQKPTLKSRHHLAQLRHLDIGLNHQHFRLEWESKDAAYKILVHDGEKCRNFLETLTLALPSGTAVSQVSTTTVSAINELVFGIDKTFELVGKGKQYRMLMTETEEAWGIKDRTLMFRTYERSFQGSDLVDLLVREGDFNSRAEAVEWCQQMLVVDVLHHVRLEEQFLDDTTLYRFSQDEPEYSSTVEFTRPSDNPNTELHLYQLCYYGDRSSPVSLVVSNVRLFITKEYHQWPLPRLQPPLPPHLRGQHFQVLHEVEISDLAMLLVADYTLTLSTESRCHELLFETKVPLTGLVSLLANLWEGIFGFPLNIC